LGALRANGSAGMAGRESVTPLRLIALHAASADVRASSSECELHAKAMRFCMVTSGSMFSR
jgi:hypothetical protein